MSLFEFTIFDQHEKQTIVDGDIVCEVFDDSWVRFKVAIDVHEIKITAFRQYVLFDSEQNPTNCLKIYLSDGSVFFSPHSLDKFKEMYITEYLPLLIKTN